MKLTPPAEFSQSQTIPEIATQPVPVCPVCGGSNFLPIARGYDYELLTCSNLWTFHQCETCRHILLNPRPADRTLPIIYPRHYYSYDMHKSVGPIAMAGKSFLDRLKFRGILKFADRPPASFLDIGCGDMKYLKVMHRNGLSPESIYGLELDERVEKQGKALGFQVFNERVETTTSIPAAGIDLATMFHVIEHVSKPDAVIARIAEWIAPGGLLVMETPNFDSLDAKLFGKSYWGGYHFPRHWHIFTRESMRLLLEKGGFTVEAVSYQTGHSFWLYSLHHLIRYNGVFPNRWLAQLFHPFKSLPMLLLATGFDLVRAKLGFRTSAMLFVARRNRAPTTG